MAAAPLVSAFDDDEREAIDFSQYQRHNPLAADRYTRRDPRTQTHFFWCIPWPQMGTARSRHGALLASVAMSVVLLLVVQKSVGCSVFQCLGVLWMLWCGGLVSIGHPMLAVRRTIATIAKLRNYLAVG